MDKKAELRKKLQQKINEKKIIRGFKEHKEKIINDNLEKIGMNDINAFKQQFKNLDIEKMTNELKNAGIDINKFLKK